MESKQRECKQRENRAVANVLIAGTAWGCIGFFTRTLSALGMSPLSISFFRSLVAALLLGIYLGISQRDILRIAIKDLWMFFGTGVVSIGAFNVFYFYTQTKTTLSIAAVLLYTAPFFVIMMSALIFKEKITKQKIIALCLAFTGCLCVTGVIGGKLDLVPIAVVSGIAAAICYALYSIFGRIALAKYPAMTVTFYSLFVSGIGIGVVFAGSGAEMPAISMKLIVFIILLAIISTMLPYIFYTKGLQVLAPSKASVLAFVEPMVATILGMVVMHEPLTLISMLGIILIFLGIIVLNRRV